MSTHNIGFYEDLTKIIFELSANIIKYAPYFFCCHGKQLRSCRDCQLPSHTVPGQNNYMEGSGSAKYNASLPETVYQYLVPILSPVTDNLLFLNQWKREIFYLERMCWRQGSISGPISETACILNGHTTDQATMPSPLFKPKSPCGLYRESCFQ